MSIRHNGNVRLSGYCDKPEKKYWIDEMNRVATLEGIPNPSVGMLFARIARAGLKLDLASLSRYEDLNYRYDRMAADPPLKRPQV